MEWLGNVALYIFNKHSVYMDRYREIKLILQGYTEVNDHWLQEKDEVETQTQLINSDEEAAVNHTLSRVHPVPELCRGGLKDTNLIVYH